MKEEEKKIERHDNCLGNILSINCHRWEIHAIDSFCSLFQCQNDWYTSKIWCKYVCVFECLYVRVRNQSVSTNKRYIQRIQTYANRHKYCHNIFINKWTLCVLNTLEYCWTVKIMNRHPLFTYEGNDKNKCYTAMGVWKDKN